MTSPKPPPAPKGNKYAIGNKGGVVNRKPPKEVREIANALIKWSKNPDSFHIAQFSSQYGKSRTWIHQLARNHPEIKEALEIARDNLLIRYLINGLTGKWYFGVVNRYLGYWDPDLNKYEIKRKRQEKEIYDKEKQELIVQTINYANAVKDQADS